MICDGVQFFIVVSDNINPLLIIITVYFANNILKDYFKNKKPYIHTFIINSQL